MTPYAHILDTIRTAEKAGVELDFDDWKECAELIEEEETNKEKTNNDTRRID